MPRGSGPKPGRSPAPKAAPPPARPSAQPSVRPSARPSAQSPVQPHQGTNLFVSHGYLIGFVILVGALIVIVLIVKLYSRREVAPEKPSRDAIQEKPTDSEEDEVDLYSQPSKLLHAKDSLELAKRASHKSKSALGLAEQCLQVDTIATDSYEQPQTSKVEEDGEIADKKEVAEAAVDLKTSETISKAKKRRRSSVGETLKRLWRPKKSIADTKSRERISEGSSTADVPPAELSDILSTKVESSEGIKSTTTSGTEKSLEDTSLTARQVKEGMDKSSSEGTLDDMSKDRPSFTDAITKPSVIFQEHLEEISIDKIDSSETSTEPVIAEVQEIVQDETTPHTLPAPPDTERRRSSLADAINWLWKQDTPIEKKPKTLEDVTEESDTEATRVEEIDLNETTEEPVEDYGGKLQEFVKAKTPPDALPEPEMERRSSLTDTIDWLWNQTKPTKDKSRPLDVITEESDTDVTRPVARESPEIMKEPAEKQENVQVQTATDTSTRPETEKRTFKEIYLPEITEGPVEGLASNAVTTSEAEVERRSKEKIDSRETTVEPTAVPVQESIQSETITHALVEHEIVRKRSSLADAIDWLWNRAKATDEKAKPLEGVLEESFESRVAPAEDVDSTKITKEPAEDKGEQVQGSGQVDTIRDAVHELERSSSVLSTEDRTFLGHLERRKDETAGASEDETMRDVLTELERSSSMLITEDRISFLADHERREDETAGPHKDIIQEPAQGDIHEQEIETQFQGKRRKGRRASEPATSSRSTDIMKSKRRRSSVGQALRKLWNPKKFQIESQLEEDFATTGAQPGEFSEGADNEPHDSHIQLESIKESSTDVVVESKVFDTGIRKISTDDGIIEQVSQITPSVLEPKPPRVDIESEKTSRPVFFKDVSEGRLSLVHATTKSSVKDQVDLKDTGIDKVELPDTSLESVETEVQESGQGETTPDTLSRREAERRSSSLADAINWLWRQGAATEEEPKKLDIVAEEPDTDATKTKEIESTEIMKKPVADFGEQAQECIRPETTEDVWTEPRTERRSMVEVCLHEATEEPGESLASHAVTTSDALSLAETDSRETAVEPAEVQGQESIQAETTTDVLVEQEERRRSSLADGIDWLWNRAKATEEEPKPLDGVLEESFESHVAPAEDVDSTKITKEPAEDKGEQVQESGQVDTIRDAVHELERSSSVLSTDDGTFLGHLERRKDETAGASEDETMRDVLTELERSSSMLITEDRISFLADHERREDETAGPHKDIIQEPAQGDIHEQEFETQFQGKRRKGRRASEPATSSRSADIMKSKRRRSSVGQALRKLWNPKKFQIKRQLEEDSKISEGADSEPHDSRTHLQSIKKSTTDVVVDSKGFEIGSRKISTDDGLIDSGFPADDLEHVSQRTSSVFEPETYGVQDDIDKTSSRGTLKTLSKDRPSLIQAVVRSSVKFQVQMEETLIDEIESPETIVEFVETQVQESVQDETIPNALPSPETERRGSSLADAFNWLWKQDTAIEEEPKTLDIAEEESDTDITRAEKIDSTEIMNEPVEDFGEQVHDSIRPETTPDAWAEPRTERRSMVEVCLHEATEEPGESLASHAVTTSDALSLAETDSRETAVEPAEVQGQESEQAETTADVLVEQEERRRSSLADAINWLWNRAKATEEEPKPLEGVLEENFESHVVPAEDVDSTKITKEPAEDKGEQVQESGQVDTIRDAVRELERSSSVLSTEDRTFLGHLERRKDETAGASEDETMRDDVTELERSSSMLITEDRISFLADHERREDETAGPHKDIIQEPAQGDIHEQKIETQFQGKRRKVRRASEPATSSRSADIMKSKRRRSSVGQALRKLWNPKKFQIESQLEEDFTTTGAQPGEFSEGADNEPHDSHIQLESIKESSTDVVEESTVSDTGIRKISTDDGIIEQDSQITPSVLEPEPPRVDIESEKTSRPVFFKDVSEGRLSLVHATTKSSVKVQVDLEDTGIDKVELPDTSLESVETEVRESGQYETTPDTLPRQEAERRSSSLADAINWLWRQGAATEEEQKKLDIVEEESDTDATKTKEIESTEIMKKPVEDFGEQVHDSIRPETTEDAWDEPQTERRSMVEVCLHEATEEPGESLASHAVTTSDALSLAETDSRETAVEPAEVQGQESIQAETTTDVLVEQEERRRSSLADAINWLWNRAKATEEEPKPLEGVLEENFESHVAPAEDVDSTKITKEPAEDKGEQVQGSGQVDTIRDAVHELERSSSVLSTEDRTFLGHLERRKDETGGASEDETMRDVLTELERSSSMLITEDRISFLADHERREDETAGPHKDIIQEPAQGDIHEQEIETQFQGKRRKVRRASEPATSSRSADIMKSKRRRSSVGQALRKLWNPKKFQIESQLEEDFTTTGAQPGEFSEGADNEPHDSHIQLESIKESSTDVVEESTVSDTGIRKISTDDGIIEQDSQITPSVLEPEPPRVDVESEKTSRSVFLKDVSEGRQSLMHATTKSSVKVQVDLEDTGIDKVKLPDTSLESVETEVRESGQYETTPDTLPRQEAERRSSSLADAINWLWRQGAATEEEEKKLDIVEEESDTDATKTKEIESTEIMKKPVEDFGEQVHDSIRPETTEDAWDEPQTERRSMVEVCLHEATEEPGESLASHAVTTSDALSLAETDSRETAVEPAEVQGQESIQAETTTGVLVEQEERRRSSLADAINWLWNRAKATEEEPKLLEGVLEENFESHVAPAEDVDPTKITKEPAEDKGEQVQGSGQVDTIRDAVHELERSSSVLSTEDRTFLGHLERRKDETGGASEDETMRDVLTELERSSSMLITEDRISFLADHERREDETAGPHKDIIQEPAQGDIHEQEIETQFQGKRRKVRRASEPATSSRSADIMKSKRRRSSVGQALRKLWNPKKFQIESQLEEDFTTTGAQPGEFSEGADNEPHDSHIQLESIKESSTDVVEESTVSDTGIRKISTDDGIIEQDSQITPSVLEPEPPRVDVESEKTSRSVFLKDVSEDRQSLMHATTKSSVKVQVDLEDTGIDKVKLPDTSLESVETEVRESGQYETTPDTLPRQEAERRSSSLADAINWLWRQGAATEEEQKKLDIVEEESDTDATKTKEIESTKIMKKPVEDFGEQVHDSIRPETTEDAWDEPQTERRSMVEVCLHEATEEPGESLASHAVTTSDALSLAETDSRETAVEPAEVQGQESIQAETTTGVLVEQEERRRSSLADAINWLWNRAKATEEEPKPLEGVLEENFESHVAPAEDVDPTKITKEPAEDKGEQVQGSGQVDTIRDAVHELERSSSVLSTEDRTFLGHLERRKDETGGASEDETMRDVLTELERSSSMMITEDRISFLADHERREDETAGPHKDIIQEPAQGDIHEQEIETQFQGKRRKVRRASEPATSSRSADIMKSKRRRSSVGQALRKLWNPKKFQIESQLEEDFTTTGAQPGEFSEGADNEPHDSHIQLESIKESSTDVVEESTVSDTGIRKISTDDGIIEQDSQITPSVLEPEPPRVDVESEKTSRSVFLKDVSEGRQSLMHATTKSSVKVQVDLEDTGIDKVKLPDTSLESVETEVRERGQYETTPDTFPRQEAERRSSSLADAINWLWRQGAATEEEQKKLDIVEEESDTDATKTKEIESTEIMKKPVEDFGEQVHDSIRPETTEDAWDEPQTERRSMVEVCLHEATEEPGESLASHAVTTSDALSLAETDSRETAVEPAEVQGQESIQAETTTGVLVEQEERRRSSLADAINWLWNRAKATEEEPKPLEGVLEENFESHVAPAEDVDSTKITKEPAEDKGEQVQGSGQVDTIRDAVHELERSSSVLSTEDRTFLGHLERRKDETGGASEDETMRDVLTELERSSSMLITEDRISFLADHERREDETAGPHKDIIQEPAQGDIHEQEIETQFQGKRRKVRRASEPATSSRSADIMKSKRRRSSVGQALRKLWNPKKFQIESQLEEDFTTTGAQPGEFSEGADNEPHDSHIQLESIKESSTDVVEESTVSDTGIRKISTDDGIIEQDSQITPSVLEPEPPRVDVESEKTSRSVFLKDVSEGRQSLMHATTKSSVKVQVDLEDTGIDKLELPDISLESVETEVQESGQGETTPDTLPRQEAERRSSSLADAINWLWRQGAATEEEQKKLDIVEEESDTDATKTKEIESTEIMKKPVEDFGEQVHDSIRPETTEDAWDEPQTERRSMVEVCLHEATEEPGESLASHAVTTSDALSLAETDSRETTVEPAEVQGQESKQAETTTDVLVEQEERRRSSLADAINWLWNRAKATEEEPKPLEGVLEENFESHVAPAEDVDSTKITKEPAEDKGEQVRESGQVDTIRDAVHELERSSSVLSTEDRTFLGHLERRKDETAGDSEDIIQGPTQRDFHENDFETQSQEAHTKGRRASEPPTSLPSTEITKSKRRRSSVGQALRKLWNPTKFQIESRLEEDSATTFGQLDQSSEGADSEPHDSQIHLESVIGSTIDVEVESKAFETVTRKISTEDGIIDSDSPSGDLTRVSQRTSSVFESEPYRVQDDIDKTSSRGILKDVSEDRPSLVHAVVRFSAKRHVDLEDTGIDKDESSETTLEPVETEILESIEDETTPHALAEQAETERRKSSLADAFSWLWMQGTATKEDQKKLDLVEEESDTDAKSTKEIESTEIVKEAVEDFGEQVQDSVRPETTADSWAELQIERMSVQPGERSEGVENEPHGFEVLLGWARESTEDLVLESGTSNTEGESRRMSTVGRIIKSRPSSKDARRASQRISSILEPQQFVDDSDKIAVNWLWKQGTTTEEPLEDVTKESQEIDAEVTKEVVSPEITKAIFGDDEGKIQETVSIQTTADVLPEIGTDDLFKGIIEPVEAEGQEDVKQAETTPNALPEPQTERRKSSLADAIDWLWNRTTPTEEEPKTLEYVKEEPDMEAATTWEAESLKSTEQPAENEGEQVQDKEQAETSLNALPEPEMSSSILSAPKITYLSDHGYRQSEPTGVSENIIWEPAQENINEQDNETQTQGRLAKGRRASEPATTSRSTDIMKSKRRRSSLGQALKTLWNPKKFQIESQLEEDSSTTSAQPGEISESADIGEVPQTEVKASLTMGSTVESTERSRSRTISVTQPPCEDVSLIANDFHDDIDKTSGRGILKDTSKYRLSLVDAVAKPSVKFQDDVKNIADSPEITIQAVEGLEAQAATTSDLSKAESERRRSSLADAINWLWKQDTATEEEPNTLEDITEDTDAEAARMMGIDSHETTEQPVEDLGQQAQESIQAEITPYALAETEAERRTSNLADEINWLWNRTTTTEEEPKALEDVSEELEIEAASAWEVDSQECTKKPVEDEGEQEQEDVKQAETTPDALPEPETPSPSNRIADIITSLSDHEHRQSEAAGASEKTL